MSDTSTKTTESLPYRLLFLDVDGTLVGHDDIPSPRTIAAIRAAQEQGCTVVICTGRHRHAVESIMAHLPEIAGAHSYGAYCNGAVLVELSTGRTLHKVGLEDEMIRHAVRLAYEHGLAPLFYGSHVEEDGGRLIYTDRRHTLHPTYAELHADRLHYLEALLETAGIAPVDMRVCGDKAAVRALAAAWQRDLGPEAMVYDCPEPKLGTNCWAAFLVNRAADKAHAARRVAEILGIPQAQTLAIGDHLNDLGMLRWAGLGVCMGDGQKAAMACADYITGTLAEDGAAKAIERFVLGQGTVR